MDRTARRPALKTGFRQRGFALVLAVTLLALLVLLVVALTTLTRVETNVARQGGATAAARQHALAGFEIALGRLQAAAGPDRRVTAAAGLLANRGVHAGNRQWVGVWDSAQTAGSPLAWLVSGAGDPSLAPPAVGEQASDGVRLVGAGSAELTVPGAEVIVRREAITAAGANDPLGRFAFWVGDEGLKGNVGAIDRVAEVPIPAAPTAADPITSLAERARIRQLFAHRSGHDALNFAVSPYGLQMAAENDPAATERWAAFGAALDDNQLRFQSLATSSATTSYRKFLRRDFHALTVRSLGLLSDTAHGGLRRNWSDLTHAPIHVQDLERARPLPAERLAIQAGHALPGQTAFQIKPVLTELAVDFLPYRDATADGAPGGRLLVGVRVRVELWNPYNLPLAHTPAGSPDYWLEIGGTRSAAPGDCGLPVVEVRAPLQPAGNVGSFDLRALLPGGRRVPLDNAGDLAPGACVVLETLVGDAIDTGLRVSDAQPTDTGDDSLALAIAADGARQLAFTLWRDGATTGEPPLTELVAFASPAATRSATGGWSVSGNAPFASAAALRDRGLSFHFRLDPARGRWGDWIAPAGGPPFPDDIRANRVSGANGEWGSVGAGADPVDAATQSALQFSPGELFAVGRTLRVADVTRQRNLSLGALAQLTQPNARPALPGQPWGGADNDVFDAAFFCPVPVSWQPGETLPNTRLRVLPASAGIPPAVAASLAADDAAQFLATAGAFNFNSVEPDAWTLLLGRSIVDWRDSSGATAPLLENPWFNFPQTAGDARAPFVGRRTFSDAAVQALANAIVARLQARGAPCGSFAELLNRGLLQSAIDDAGWNTAPAFVADLGGVPPEPFGPDYVTQATLLNALAPVLAARSDTFRIRVCGESLNAVDGAVESRAFLEAIVQRLPEPVGAAMSPMADATGYGRRFVLVGFRWMNEIDL